MAKRKRLGPADAFGAAPEVKSALPHTRPLAPPIAVVAGEAAAQSALGEMTQALESARAEGRLLQMVNSDDIAMDHLIRDRVIVGEDDMQALMDSLQNRGQQTPIEIVDLGADSTPRFGLISGWRRMTALSRLGQTQVLARVIDPQSQGQAYQAMVEENEIRVGLSFYERAHIVLRAERAGVYDTRKDALQKLFAHVSRAKRSKVKSFVTVVEALGGDLTFPGELGERLGLELARAIDAGHGSLLRAALAPQFVDAAAEQDALKNALSSIDSTGASDAEPDPVPLAKSAAKPVSAPPAPAPTDTHSGDAPMGSAWPDVYVKDDGRQITLAGKGVTGPFKAALLAWLSVQDG